MADNAHPHHVMNLNNWLQTGIGTGALKWTTERTGERHAPTWKATAIIKDVEYGQGTGNTIQEAKEAAAEKALIALRQKYGA